MVGVSTLGTYHGSSEHFYDARGPLWSWWIGKSEDRDVAAISYSAPHELVSGDALLENPAAFTATSKSCIPHGGTVATYGTPQHNMNRYYRMLPVGRGKSQKIRRKAAGASDVLLRFPFQEELYNNANIIAAATAHKDAFTKLTEVVYNYNNLDVTDRRARLALMNKILSATDQGKKVLAFFNDFRSGTMENVQKLLAAATTPAK
jgi:hypothetical protein